MKKVRVYELAKDLEISSKELMERMKELGLEVSSHMSTLEKEDAKLVTSLIKDQVEESEEKADNGQENVKFDSEKKEKVEQVKPLDEGNEEIIDEKNKVIDENREIEEEIDEDAIRIGNTIVVRDLAEKLDVTPAQVITKLIGLGVMVNQNQEIESDIAISVGEEFEANVIVDDGGEEEEQISLEEEIGTIEEIQELDFEDDPEDLEPRAPIVTVMGHVDHGKTSLLDAIKKTRVTSSEAGGITQHIGAYSVEVNNKKISFLDTPGHEAFTSMRARGAQLTDIAILVVAADDGVMPQTIEAISHAKAAEVPIIVAINKMDKPDSDIDRVKQDLVENGIMPEDWGGDVITVPVSAKAHTGIDELLEMVLLVAEIQELKANPNREAIGIVVEAQLDKGKGPMATLLVKKGTLHVGDMVVSGSSYGRVRAMFDDKGENTKSAGPSVPVVILGLSEVPNAGDLIYGVKNEKLAKTVASKYKNVVRARDMKTEQKVSLDDLFERIKLGELKDLNIVMKGDVRGSIEALKQSLLKLDTDEVLVNVIHQGVGGISESDIMLASASNAIVIGFNVRPNLNAMEVAKREQVDIRTYRVIYEAIEDIESAIKGMHAPTIVEEVIGRAEVRETFRLPTGNTIAGIYVVNGKIARRAKVRLLRDDVVIFEGDISSLKRFKDDAREVASGYEAGIGLDHYNDLKEKDIIEAYILKEVQK